MTALAVSATSPSPLGDVSLTKILRQGAIGGLVVILIVAIGMFESFESRVLIDPFLRASTVVLFWVPMVFGYRISLRPVLEGAEPPKPGLSNVITGMATGAVAGLGVGLFVILASNVDIRTDAFINVTPSVLNTLSIGGSAATGALALTIIGAVVGGLGGAIHFAGDRLRKVLSTVAITILLLNFLELAIGDTLRSLGWGRVDRLIYTSSRGLTLGAAITFSVAAVIIRFAMKGRTGTVRARFDSLPAQNKSRWLLAIGLIALGLGAFLPSLFGLFLNDVLANVGLFVLLALGLNIVIGYAGLLDLGYVAFFAVGAYTAAVATSPQSPAITPEMAFFEALPWVLLMAAIAGLIIGTPVIRMRGDYLAIVTLGFGEIIRILFLSDWLSGVFGGAQGILRIAPIDRGSAASGIRVHFGYVVAAIGLIALIVGFMNWREQLRLDRGVVEPIPGRTSRPLTGYVLLGGGLLAVVLGVIFYDFATWNIRGISPPDMFRIILVFAALAAFVSWRLRDSRVGRAWMAVREDEQIAQSMGINIVTTKLLAFVIGAMLASFGGALFAVKLGTIFPHSFQIVQSIIILVIVIVGGMGSIRGVIIGAVVLIGVLGGPTQSGLLREFGEYKLLIYGALLVFMMLKKPEGLWPEARRAQELHQEDAAQDAWLTSAGVEEGAPAE